MSKVQLALVHKVFRVQPVLKVIVVLKVFKVQLVLAHKVFKVIRVFKAPKV